MSLSKDIINDTNYIGCYAEELFSAECIKRGIAVNKPVLDSSIYDCVIDVKGELLKIQIKATTKEPRDKDPNIQVPLMNGNKQNYILGSVDYFAVYSTHYNGFFIFPNSGGMQGVRVSLTGSRKHFFNNFDFIEDNRYNQLDLFNKIE